MHEARCQLPDHTNRQDEVLLRQGFPDVLLLVQGHRLWAHSEILGKYSPRMRAELAPERIDPIYGKQILFRSPMTGTRTREAVVALLNAMYPAVVFPPPRLLGEVCDIAEEYGMHLLLEQLRFGAVKAGSLEPLLALDRVGHPMPDLLLDTFAGFTLEDLKSLPGYDLLSSDTKHNLASRRLAALEAHLAHPALRAWREEHQHRFRRCPDELARPDPPKVPAVAPSSAQWSRTSPASARRSVAASPASTRRGGALGASPTSPATGRGPGSPTSPASSMRTARELLATSPIGGASMGTPSLPRSLSASTLRGALALTPPAKASRHSRSSQQEAVAASP